MKPAMRFLPLFAAAMVLTGCNRDASPPLNGNKKEGVTISDARMVMPVVSGSPAAGYFTIQNDGDAPVTVMTIDIQGTQMVMMHETVDVGGKSRMDMLQSLEVPAHQAVKFEPGGKHLMISGLAPEVKAGTMSRITFTFADGEKVAEDLPVVPPAVGGPQ